MTVLLDTSVAEEYRYIKEFDFSSGIGRNPFTDLVFSNTALIRFDFNEGCIRLRQLDGGFYSVEDDIYFRTWVTTPKAVRSLLMIQVKGSKPTNTNWQVRLYNGTNHLFWDAAAITPAWAVAGAGDWNDEATINAHLSTYPLLPGRSFAVVVNLVTTDRYVTPTVTEVLVLTKIRIDYLEDIIFRSLIPMMKAYLRPVGNFPLPPVELAHTTTFDLDSYELETPFNIVSIEAVYNFTDDPELLNNLYSSYHSGTRVITVTTEFDVGDIPFVIFRYEPEIVYTTSQDYVEVSKLPAIIIKGIEVPTQSAYNLAAREAIVDKGTGNAVIILEPGRATLEFRLHATADRSVDELRMMSAIMKFFDTYKSVRSVGLDESYTMQLIREIRDITNPNRADKMESWTRFQIVDLRMPMVSQDAHGITRLVCRFSEPETPLEDLNLGGSRIVFRSHKDDTPEQWEESFDIPD